MIAELAAQHSIEYHPENTAHDFGIMSLHDIRGARDKRYLNVLVDKD